MDCMKKRSLKIWIFSLLLLLPIDLINQNQVNKSVLGNGATNTNNASNSLKGTIGQTVIGSTNNGSYINNQGFWYVANINVEAPTVSISEDTDADSVTAVYTARVVSDGGSQILERGIIISTTPNPTLSDYLFKDTVYADTGSYTIRFRGLQNSTRYYARAYAINVKGTSYSPAQDVLVHDQDGVSSEMERGVPNHDGNGDGIPDYAQMNVVSFSSIYRNHGYLTIEVDPSFEIINAINKIQTEDRLNYFYPYGITTFSIAADSVAVTFYYHDVDDLKSFTYRKQNNLGQWYDFPNVEFEQVVINGRTVAKITLMLYDGGLGDADSEVNGVILDPGGPAISTPLISSSTVPSSLLVNATSIPTLSEWARILAILFFITFGIYITYKRKYLVV